MDDNDRPFVQQDSSPSEAASATGQSPVWNTISGFFSSLFSGGSKESRASSPETEHETEERQQVAKEAAAAEEEDQDHVASDMFQRVARDRIGGDQQPTRPSNNNNKYGDSTMNVERSRKRTKSKKKKVADFRCDDGEEDDPSYSPTASKKRRKTKTIPKKATKAAKDSSGSRRQRKRDAWILRTTHIIQTQVFQAAAVVAQALSSGPWPSAMLPVSDVEDDDALNDSSHSSTTNGNDAASPSPLSQLQDQHIAHLSIVGASLQQFAADVVLPSITHAVQDSMPTTGALVQYDQSWRRPLLGTFLMLREVLIQNGDAIFGRGHLLLGKLHQQQQQQQQQDDNKDVATRKTAAPGADTTAWYRMPYNILLTDPTVLFGVRVLASSIILHAIELLLEWNVDATRPDLAEEFLTLAHAYDQGDSKVFAMDLLSAVMQSTPALLRTGEPVSFEHAKSYKHAFHICLKQHPLGPGQNSTAPSVSEPNAVHVTVLQNASQ